jgi:HEAT repeat protein
MASESAELRARTLDALQAAGLDASLLAGVQAGLSSPDWLVRLMAVRLLGERKPPQWEARLRPLAVEDADELVRALAASYLPALEPPGGEIGSATGAPAH